jgi:hypothetical protein
VEDLTREHLFPKAWYLPEYTPPNTTRQTFPSCSGCNSKHGESERRLRQNLGLSLNPDEGIGAGIAKAVIHSLSMTEAPSEKEAHIRGKQKMQLLNEAIYVPEGEDHEGLNLLPGLQVDQELLEKGGYSLTKLSGADVRNLADKIVRGIMYLEYQLFLEEEQEVVWVPDYLDIFRFADSHYLNLPGLFVKFGPIPSKDTPAVVFVIQSWSKLTIHALCTPGKDSIWFDTILGDRVVEPLWNIESGSYDRDTPVIP